MRKAVTVIFAATLIIVQGIGPAVADQATALLPSAYLSYSFADRKVSSPLHFGAQLSLLDGVDSRPRAEAWQGPIALKSSVNVGPTLPALLQLDMQPQTQASLRFMGSDVAGYRYRLEDTTTESAQSSGWFANNWGWVAGAGALVVGGIVAVAIGGSHSSNDAKSGSDNCQSSQPVSVTNQCGDVLSGPGTR